MGSTLVIASCILLVLAYLFELSSKYTRIPTILLLLLCGYLVNQLVSYFGIERVPNLEQLLPTLGTLGLLLIVLDGSMELELDHSKRRMIESTFFAAIIPLLFTALYISFLFYLQDNTSFRNALIHAIPFVVISSAVAIPISSMLRNKEREFVVYESSFSDILGVFFFNFIVLNAEITLKSASVFGLQLLLLLVISVLASLFLSVLVRKLDHKVKFMPIIISVILIYFLVKGIHLPALLFVLIFGIFLANLDQFKGIPMVEKLHPEDIEDDIEKFKEITGEVTFVVRALFFMIFGYTLETYEIINPDSILLSLMIVAGVFVIRGLYLSIVRLPLTPLIYMAPRGLITILLFLSIPLSSKISFVNRSVLVQVVLLTVVITTIGLLFSKQEKKPEVDEYGSAPEPEALV